MAIDAKIADDFSNDAKTAYADVNEIPDGWEGLDIGPKTIALYAEVIKNSKTILWNGPTGVFEFENFTDGSRAVGEAIVEATKNGAFSLVGGGDSVVVALCWKPSKAKFFRASLPLRAKLTNKNNPYP